MLPILLSLICGALAGVVAGVVTARWLLSRQRLDALAPLEPADPFISAELDQAAANWATDTGQPPQAASLMADKLHLLYALGRKRQS